MQTLTLPPGQTENITLSTTLLIQNLDPYTNIEVSRFDVSGTLSASFVMTVFDIA